MRVLFYVVFMPCLAFSQSWPLKISSNGRYLEDQHGVPFFMSGDAGWTIISELTLNDAKVYISNRKQKGFNAVKVMLPDNYSSTAPANKAGDTPFTGRAFTTPRESYWLHADSVVQVFSDSGFLIHLFPAYAGYGCNTTPPGGWADSVNARGADSMKWYGQWIGNRYKNFPNMHYILNGDVAANTCGQQIEYDSLARGIIIADTIYRGRIMGTYNDPESYSRTGWSGRSWLLINGMYTYSTSSHSWWLAGYNQTPVMPTYPDETSYENEHSSTPQSLRAQAYWGILSGATGHFFGSCPVYDYGYLGGQLCSETNWKGWMDSAGSVSMKYVQKLFTSRYWWRMWPDTDQVVMTAGFQSGTTYATTCTTTDSTSILAYIPTQRTVTIQGAWLKGDSMRVRWFNPSSGAVTDSGVYVKGSRTMNPPTATDWVLVIDNKDLRWGPPGTPLRKKQIFVRR